MDTPAQRDALRVIQDIIAQAKGSPLQGEAVKRLRNILATLAAGSARPSSETAYSKRHVTIVFADLRGFTALAASHSTENVLGVLNRCFGIMVEIVVRHYGTVDKFMGDAMMVLFHGDPAMPRDHARRALLCSVEMQIAMRQLREQHLAENLPELYMGIGISTGEVMAGLIGSDAYRAYTVIGDEVNLAARIEALSLRGQILMSETTYAPCKDFVNAGDPMEVYVKGRSDLVLIREVLGIPALSKVVPRQDARKSARVPVQLDVQYWPLYGKSIQQSGAQGLIRDISYHGLLIELPQPLNLHTELKLAFDLPAVAFRAEEVYGRIVSIRQERGHFLAGIEFTSLSGPTGKKLQLFVQMLLQGSYAAPLA